MGISVSIKKRLRDFDLDVEWEAGNELVALFGYSGSGKTMTLKAISGIVTPDSGKICLEKSRIYDSEAGINHKPQKRRIGYVFQDLALFPHMSVWDNISYGLYDSKSRESKSRVSEMIDIFRLNGLEKKYPSTLSGGQRQRVAFARALAVKPDLLLLDEPFSALDSMIRLEMRSVLKAVQNIFGIPVLLVTHDFPEALEVADKMIVYSDGKIQQIGAPEFIFMNPCNDKVSELLSGWRRKSGLKTGNDNECKLNERFKVICGGYYAA